MSNSATFRIEATHTPAPFGLWTLFTGVDGLARAAGAVALGSFLLGVTIVLVASAA